MSANVDRSVDKAVPSAANVFGSAVRRTRTRGREGRCRAERERVLAPERRLRLRLRHARVVNGGGGEQGAAGDPDHEEIERLARGFGLRADSPVSA